MDKLQGFKFYLSGLSQGINTALQLLDDEIDSDDETNEDDSTIIIDSDNSTDVIINELQKIIKKGKVKWQDLAFKKQIIMEQ